MSSSEPAPLVDARALIAGQLVTLGRLAEAGLNLALAVERQALAAEAESQDHAPTALAEAALAYGRVSRAVRLTLALQGRTLKDLQALDEVAARMARGARSQAEQAAREQAVARKAKVGRIVERLIRDEAADNAEGDRLTDEAYERLEQDDIYGDLTARPVREIIALICRDLGLSPDWSRLAQEAWSQDEIDAEFDPQTDTDPDEAPADPPRVTFRWLAPPGELSPDPDPGRVPAAVSSG
jgi:hypothetical protein